MTTTATPASARLFHKLALVALTMLAAAGCGAGEGLDEQDEAATSTEESELRNTGRGPRQSFSCSNGTCTCDKSIENDCADMSAVCTDGTVDALITCINGWLTTHCTCTQARTAQPAPQGTIVGTLGPKTAARK